MKKWIMAVAVVLSLSAMVMTDANARRFGGGSFGRQSMNIGRPAPMGPSMSQTNQARTPAQQQRAATTGAKQQTSGMSRWGGLLGGALLGLGLGALLSHFGIGGDLAGMISTILMLAIIFFVARWIFRKMFGRKEQPPAYQRAGSPDPYGQPHDNRNAPGLPEIGSGIAGGAGAYGAADDRSAVGAWSVPADFDTAGFLRTAKSYFIRLQAAWDKGDMNDIHQITSAEMFAEINMQLMEREPGENITVVEELHADLLGVETFKDEMMASVKFSGRIRDGVKGDTEYFEEVWNLTKPVDGSRPWVLAGVQQIA